MQTYIAKDGQQLGPLDEMQARDMLAEGTISGTDLAWHAALPDWQSLASVLGTTDTTSLAADGTILSSPRAGGRAQPTPSAYPLAADLASPGSRLGASLMDSLFSLVIIRLSASLAHWT